METFTPDERRVLAPYFTDLDGPVFALVNLPEVVKGALFARYSRSPKSLRRLFLDEFADQVPAEAPTASSIGTARAEALYERVLGRLRRRLGGAARRRPPGLRGRLEPPDQGARVGPAHGVSRAVDPLRAVRRPAGRPLRGTTCPPSSTATRCGARYVETLDRAFETYARWHRSHARAYWSARVPQAGGREPTPPGARPSAPRPSTARAGSCPRPRGPTSASSAPARATRRSCCACARTPCARCATTRSSMLVELRKVIPAFLRRLERPERGGAWSGYLARTPRGDGRARRGGSCDGIEPEPRGRGDADRLRSGRRGEGGGGRALRRLGSARRPAPRHRAEARPERARRGARRLRRRGARTGATSPAAPSSAPPIASTCSATTAPSAISSATGCSRSSGSGCRRATATRCRRSSARRALSRRLGARDGRVGGAARRARRRGPARRSRPMRWPWPIASASTWS